MECGMKNKVKTRFYNVIHAFVCCAVLITVHDYGHYIYTQHYRVISHGVTLGFIQFYMLYVMIPSIFIMSFLRGWPFYTTFTIVLLPLLYTWLPSNPLRVSLMVASYAIATICLFFLQRINKYPG